MVCFMSQALIVYYIKAVPTHYQYSLLKSKMISQLLSFRLSVKPNILFDFYPLLKLVLPARRWRILWYHS